MRPWPLMARDTVVTDSPSSAAMSLKVTPTLLPPSCLVWLVYAVLGGLVDVRGVGWIVRFWVVWLVVWR